MVFKVYSLQDDDEEKNILPEVKLGEKISIEELIDEQHFTSLIQDIQKLV